MRRFERGPGVNGTLALLLFAAAAGHAQAPAPPRAAPARPAPARPAPILPERLVGRWSDSGDCGKYVVFRGDGTFRAHTGGEGNWRLNRGRLTMTGGGTTRTLIVRRLDITTLEVENPDGSLGRSRRC
ncbi:MAG TPA: hypothetical protein VLK25_13100 [Allosphingosinicella sp.]|nr:hypothetical protein [Allosphingosinicella sp.]